MRFMMFAAVSLGAALAFAAPVLTGQPVDFEDGFEGPPKLLTGKILLSLTMPIPEEDRQAIVDNAALLEAEGLTVAGDGSFVVFPDATPAGWLVRFGAVETLAGADGTFVLDLTGVGANSGSIWHPSHEDDVPIGTFSREDLVPDGETPVPVILQLPFEGPCGMTVGPDNPAHCQVAQATSLDVGSGGHLSKARNIAHRLPEMRLLDTYPPSPRETNCQILDGWIDSDTSALGSYFGSTCFTMVINGLCPNEGGFGIFAEEICCFKNHRGRFCQELLPGDMKLLDLSHEALTILDEPIEFTVHNNSTWAETTVITWLEKGIGGQMPPQGSYFDGEGGIIQHYDAAKLAAWSCETDSASDGADIYVADRTVVYEPPRCLSEAPASDAKDQYRVETRDGRENFVLTFTLHQSVLWKFVDSGQVFDLGQAIENRGSFLAEPEPVEPESGCPGQHIHGLHPCTSAPDPEPTKCGHGIVVPLNE